MSPGDNIGRELDKVLTEMSDNLNVKALRKKGKGVLRSSAKKIRKVAVANLRRSKLDADMSRLARNVRIRVAKDCTGYEVTVGPGKKNGNVYTTRRGAMKPVALWAEDGTKARMTHTYRGGLDKRGRLRPYGFRKRKGHPTGRMQPVKFLQRAEGRVQSTLPDLVSGFEQIAGEIIKRKNYD